MGAFWAIAFVGMFGSSTALWAYYDGIHEKVPYSLEIDSGNRKLKNMELDPFVGRVA